MSGYSDTEAAEHGPPPAGLPMVQKPFNTKDLLRTLREVLEGRRRPRREPVTGSQLGALS